MLIDIFLSLSMCFYCFLFLSALQRGILSEFIFPDLTVLNPEMREFFICHIIEI